MFGYIPDPPDVRDLHLPALGLSGLPPTKAEALREAFPGPPLIQGETEGCAGWSFAHCAWARWSLLAGLPVNPPPSPLFAWWGARKIDGTEHENVGTYLRSVNRQAVKFGICSEPRWPLDNLGERFGTQPDQRAFQHAIDHRYPLGYYRIDQIARRTKFMQAIAAGHPVQFGAMVSFEFMALGDHDPIPPPGMHGMSPLIAGGHAMAALAYDEHGIYGPNSWDNWGNDGWFALSWDYVLSEFLIDAWAIAIEAPPSNDWWMK